MKCFDEKTIAELQYYVYMLIDPSSNKPFYIGKGNGNRVFNHVYMCIKDEDIISLKYNKIREIGPDKVKYIIIRHGLKENEALTIESSCIDLLQYLQYPLANLQSGNKSLYKGLMSVEEVNNIYAAMPLDSIPLDCMIININNSYKIIRKGSHLIPTVSDIYNATRGVWSMDIKKAMTKKYVLSVYKGLVIEVFEIEEWYPEKRGYTPSSKKHGNAKRLGCAFNGKVAPDAIRDLYINKSIKHRIQRGAAMPFRYSI